MGARNALARAAALMERPGGAEWEEGASWTTRRLVERLGR
jgi:hypothetical protein